MIDLHMHSTASDGALPPEDVVSLAAGAGLSAIALTDHDTLAGVPAAVAAGERLGIRVISGCEFSTQAPWGEMHVLGYFLPLESSAVEEFLVRCREDRERRGNEIVERLRKLGLKVTREDLMREADGASIGRPHVARALLRLGAVRTIQEAFDRYIGWNRPGFVEKRLPTFKAVAELVHTAGGVVSAAHLRDRANSAFLAELKSQGLDAVETRHPVHDPDQRSRLTDMALSLGLLRSGGSDWHAADQVSHPGAEMGGQDVPDEWLAELEGARPLVLGER